LCDPVKINVCDVFAHCGDTVISRSPSLACHLPPFGLRLPQTWVPPPVRYLHTKLLDRLG
jgi:hypothetical protein